MNFFDFLEYTVEEKTNVRVYNFARLFMQQEVPMENLFHLHEPQPDRRFRSARNDDAELDAGHVLRLRQSSNDASHVVVVVALVQCIHDDDQHWMLRTWLHLSERLRDKLRPLVVSRLARNVWLILYRFRDELLHTRSRDSQLLSDARKEHACRRHGFSSTSRKEEARSKIAFVAELPRYCACDCRLPRPRHPIQPEDAAPLFSVCPCSYLLQHFRTRVLEAQRVVLLARGVERGLRRRREIVDRQSMVCVSSRQIERPGCATKFYLRGSR